jgi:hypothetical protein
MLVASLLVAPTVTGLLLPRWLPEPEIVVAG